jgi:hypothetical protein
MFRFKWYTRLHMEGTFCRLRAVVVIERVMLNKQSFEKELL